MFGIGGRELLIILVIILILFGASRIPKLMRSIGEGLREFKKGLSGEDTPKQGNPPHLPPDTPDNQKKN